MSAALCNNIVADLLCLVFWKRVSLRLGKIISWLPVDSQIIKKKKKMKAKRENLEVQEISLVEHQIWIASLLKKKIHCLLKFIIC